MKKTKSNYEKYLNEIGIPENYKKSNGGRVPDYANYGKRLCPDKEFRIAHAKERY